MTSQRPSRLAEALDTALSLDLFHRRFAPLFGRREAQRLSQYYLRRLLTHNMRHPGPETETVADASPRAVQRFLSDSPWPTEPVIDALQRELGQWLNAPDGSYVVGEIGFPKQGAHSVGVAHQPCGPHGRVGNCQIGIFLAYASSRGHALIDARLYLPEPWVADSDRRRHAGVPPDLIHRSRPELALDLLRHARARGHLDADWVTCRERFGEESTVRDALDADGWHYLLGVPATTRVRSKRSQHSGSSAALADARSGHAQPAGSNRSLDLTLASQGWHEITVDLGGLDPWPYHFAVTPVLGEGHDRSGTASWLLVRRELDGQDPRYYLSNAPIEMPLTMLAQVTTRRESTASLFDTAGSETSAVGLADYEGRSWTGWHHHMALALLLGAYLLEAESSRLVAPNDASE